MNDLQLVVQMIAYMEQNLTEDLHLEDLAGKSGYSANRFRQKFYHVTGDTPSGYLRKRRLTEAAKEILSGKRSLDISLDYGYSSQENFITAFRGYFGITPAELFAMDAKFKRFYSRFREVLNIMEIADLKQPPLNSTDMGCIKGASDYFDNDLSTAMVYGLSGYGFMINIHRDLCPSGPYVWNRERFHSLLRDQGVDFQRAYRIDRSHSREERMKVEEDLKDYLNRGWVCVLGYLESQLLSGYDEEGFIFLSPWEKGPTVVPRMTFGSWEECLEREGWAYFNIYAPRGDRLDLLTSVRRSWEYALELYRTPEKHASEGYRINYGGLENWIDCVKRDLGGSHGNWWNGMVWSEARHMTADYFRELEGLFDSPEMDNQLEILSGLYDDTAMRLEKIADRELEKEEKLRLLGETMEREREIEKVLDRALSLAG